MNIELLNKVKSQILIEPTRFNMMFFECEGIRCILGWAVELFDFDDELNESHKFLFTPTDYTTAGTLHSSGYALDITGEQCQKLGYVELWPLEFKNAYSEIFGQTAVRERLLAKLAVERIDHFIATEGRE